MGAAGRIRTRDPLLRRYGQFDQDGVLHAVLRTHDPLSAGTGRDDCYKWRLQPRESVFDPMTAADTKDIPSGLRILLSGVVGEPSAVRRGVKE
jgi:hypothetical protein